MGVPVATDDAPPSLDWLCNINQALWMCLLPVAILIRDLRGRKVDKRGPTNMNRPVSLLIYGIHGPLSPAPRPANDVSEIPNLSRFVYCTLWPTGTAESLHQESTQILVGTRSNTQVASTADILSGFKLRILHLVQTLYSPCLGFQLGHTVLETLIGHIICHTHISLAGQMLQRSGTV